MKRTLPGLRTKDTHRVKQPGREPKRLHCPQVIDREKQKERGFAVTRIVADAGIEAAQRPIHLIVPAVAAVFSLRTVALGLQIFVENEMFRNTNKVASASLSQTCFGPGD